MVKIICCIFAVAISSNAWSESKEGLCLWLKFDEGKGDIIKDSSEYKNNGKIFGASWVDGKSGQALYFDGKDDYVEIPDSPSLNPEEITIACWINIESRTSGGDRIVEKLYNSAYCVDLGGRSFMFSGKIGDSVQQFRSEEKLEYGRWHHIAVAYGGTGVKFYIDGELSGSKRASPQGKLGTTNRVLRIGGHAPGQKVFWFNGIIDEVKIYSRQLNIAEIQAQYEDRPVRALSPSVIEPPSTHKLTKDSAVLIWETDMPMSGIVEFGPDQNYGKRIIEPSKEFHEVILSELKPDTQYYYRVTSEEGKLIGRGSFATAPVNTRAPFIQEIDMTNPSDRVTGIVIKDFRDNLYLYLKNSTDDSLEIENIYVDDMDIKTLAEKTRYNPLQYSKSSRNLIIWYDIVPNPIPAGEWGLIRIRFGDINMVGWKIDVRLITDDGRSFNFNGIKVIHEQLPVKFKSYSLSPELDRLYLYLETDEADKIEEVLVNGKKVTIETLREVKLKDKVILFMSISFPKPLIEGEYKIVKVKMGKSSNDCLFRVIKPFFPLGLFTIGSPTGGWFMEDAVKHLINFGDHPHHPADIEEKYGLKMFVHPVNWDASFPDHFTWIKGFDSKSVYTWMLTDEPDPGRADGPPIKLMGWMKDYRKYGWPHPVYVNHTAGEQPWFEYNFTDIVAFDHYPVPGETRVPVAQRVKDRGTLYKVSELMDMARTAVAPNPVWYIPPAYYTQQEEKIPQDRLYDLARFPTPEEERILVYQSVSHGGKGIIYFSIIEDCLKGTEKSLDELKLKAAKLLWEEIGRINLELHLLSHLLLKGEPLPLGESNQEKVEVCSILSGEEAIVVFAINHDYDSTFDYEKVLFRESKDVKIVLRLPGWFKPVDVFSISPEGLTKLSYNLTVKGLSFSLNELKSAQDIVISADRSLFSQLEEKRKELCSIISD